MRSMITTSLLTLALAGLALAADPVTTPPRPTDAPTPPTVDVAPLEGGTAKAAVDGEAVSSTTSLRPAMMEELREVRERELAAVTELLATLETTVAHEERHELQKQIMRAKSDATLAGMTIQLEYAERGGFVEQAERLEAEIELFETRRDAPRAAVVTDSVRDRRPAGGEAR